MSLTHKVNGTDQFVVDEANSDATRCVIDLPGLGSVDIVRRGGELDVLIYSEKAPNVAIATLSVPYKQLEK